MADDYKIPIKILIFYIISVISLSGCYSVRKKFVRKKKQQEEAAVYVNFKDYQDSHSKEDYIYNYQYLIGWLEDLRESVQEEFSLKREKRAIKEAIRNLDELIYFYNQQGKEKVQALYNELLAIQKEIENNPNINEIRRKSLITRIANLKDAVKADLNYNAAQRLMD